MAELTIQISDELAQRLEPLQHRLPELFLQLLETSNFLEPTSLELKQTSTDIPAVYQEIIDFLIKRPTLEEIVSFKVSPQAQARLSTLLEKNSLATLTEPELAELNAYEQLEHLMILLKARAVKIFR